MASAPTELWNSLTDRLGEDVLPRLMVLASIDTEAERKSLDEAGLVYCYPDRDCFPELHELDATADVVTGNARRSATWTAVGGSLGGLAGVPPKLLADLATRLRLAQRLAVVYGFDPKASRGELLVRKAIYAAYGIPWPEESVVGNELLDLPALIQDKLPQAGQAVRWATRAAVMRVLKTPVRRMMAWVPGLTTSVSAYGARKEVSEQAEKMKEVFRGAWEGGATSDVEEAIEIAASPTTG